jgi:hypothetical protein
MIQRDNRQTPTAQSVLQHRRRLPEPGDAFAQTSARARPIKKVHL